MKELLCEDIQVFDYSIRRQSSCEHLHKDEVVILNSELAIHSLVSDMLMYLALCILYIFLTKFKKINYCYNSAVKGLNIVLNLPLFLLFSSEQLVIILSSGDFLSSSQKGNEALFHQFWQWHLGGLVTRTS